MGVIKGFITLLQLGNVRFHFSLAHSTRAESKKYYVLTLNCQLMKLSWRVPEDKGLLYMCVR